jgi:hypothetical protein
MTTALRDLDALESIDIDGRKAQGVPPVAPYLVDEEKFVLLAGKRGIYRLAGAETACYFTSLDQIRLHLLEKSLTRVKVGLA